MNILEIYRKYSIPLNLQQHMLRVAALGSFICWNFNTTGIDREVVEKSLLLHDMGNILKFDFTNIKMLDPKDQKRIPELIKTQNIFKQKYGGNIDKAIIKIVSEITKNERIIRLIIDSHWENGKIISSQNEKWMEKICMYSDVRIGPFGIVPLEKRYANLMLRVTPESKIKLEAQIPHVKEIEHQIQLKCSVNLSEILDSDLDAQFAMLKQITIE